jgi:hypothetical protein
MCQDFSGYKIVITESKFMIRKNKFSFKSFIVAALVGGSMVSSVGNANATFSLDYTFGFGNPTPIIHYDPNTGTLAGTIAITTITGIDTPQNSDTPFFLSGGVLSFVTGQYDAKSGIFASGGTFTVTGGISGIPALSDPKTTLLSGSFDSGASLTETPRPAKNGGGMSDVFEATMSTTGSQPLYKYFYLGTPTVSSATEDLSLAFVANLGLTANNNANRLIGGNILETPVATPNGNIDATTPIPAALWLLGSGLMGLAGLRSRRSSVI